MAIKKLYCGELLWHLSDANDTQFALRRIDRSDLLQTLLVFYTNDISRPDSESTENPALQLYHKYESLRMNCGATDADRKAAFQQALDELFPVIPDRKVVYICSPYSGDIQKNIQNACVAAKTAIISNNVAPLVPHLMYPTFLDDDNPTERALGIELDLNLISKCDELWYYGDTISAGMQAEINFAKTHNIPVIHKNWPESVQA